MEAGAMVRMIDEMVIRGEEAWQYVLGMVWTMMEQIGEKDVSSWCSCDSLEKPADLGKGVHEYIYS